MKKIRTGVLAGCGLAAAVLSVQSAHAATIYSTGFETSEGYTAGNLVGQTGGTPKYTYAANGTAAGSTVPSDITAAINSGTAVITATNLSVNNNAGTGDAAVFFPSIPLGTINTVANPIVTVSSSINVTSSSAAVSGFGLEIFNGATPTESPIFSVFALSDGSFDYTANGVSTDPGIPTPGGAFSVPLNYTTGQYALSIGSTLESTGAFSSTSGIGTVGIAGATFDSTAGATGTGTFDNFSISAVPEPATGSIVMAGLAVAGLRRRRTASR